MVKIVHKGFKINAGHLEKCWYFYPECGCAVGRTPEKIFGSYRNEKERAKYLRNYSKSDIILLTDNWKKVTCKECLRRHPNSAENIKNRKRKVELMKAIAGFNKIIMNYEKMKRAYYNELHGIEHMWDKKAT